MEFIIGLVIIAGIVIYLKTRKNKKEIDVNINTPKYNQNYYNY